MCEKKKKKIYINRNIYGTETSVGKTDNLRLRTNNHISSCRTGNGTNLFDLHVHSCAKKQKKELVEPFFKLFAFMELTDYNALRNHERRLHLQGHDTINKPNSSNTNRL